MVCNHLILKWFYYVFQTVSPYQPILFLFMLEINLSNFANTKETVNPQRIIIMIYIIIILNYKIDKRYNCIQLIIIMEFVLKKGKVFNYKKEREKKNKLNSHVRELRVHSLSIAPPDCCSRLRALLGGQDWQI